MNKKIIKYIIISFFIIFPFLVGCIGGDIGAFITEFINELYGFIVVIARHALLTGIIITIISFGLLVSHMYIIRKRTVSFFTYFYYLLKANLSFFFLLIALSTVGLLALTYLVALGTDKIFFNVDFIHVKNFTTLYLIELYIYSIYYSLKAAVKSVTKIEAKENVKVAEKMDKKRKVEYSGDIGEYFNEINNALKDTFNSKFKYTKQQQLYIKYPTKKMELNDKIDYLKHIDLIIENFINEYAEKNNLELKCIHSNYEKYVGFDHSQKPKDLKFENETISKLKYTLYKYLRNCMTDINRVSYLYLNGKSNQENTKFNRLDEIVLEKQIYESNDINIIDKQAESINFYVEFVKQLNILIEQIKYNKSIILNSSGSRIKSEVEEFDKEGTIMRNLKINDELLVDPDAMIFTLRGVYSIMYQNLDVGHTYEATEDLKWVKVEQDGTKTIIGDVLTKIKTDLHAEETLMIKNIKISIEIEPIIIVNDAIKFVNNSNLTIIKEDEVYTKIMSLPKKYEVKELKKVIDLFANNNKVSKDYIEVDYEKALNNLLDIFMNYCNNDIKYYTKINNAYKELITKEKMASKNYLKSYEEAEILYYSYDFALHQAGQKYYADNTFDMKLSYDTKKID